MIMHRLPMALAFKVSADEKRRWISIRPTSQFLSVTVRLLELIRLFVAT